ncbi:hypothetical protein [Bacillus sp. OV322]|uniref:hypothetical protein n=1 Tax=Bacillus sp. OV322 TaxID=1882764 RepID=UPI000B857A67|nr:hypothetical protein [Bacillus sp. OV322]
MNVIVSNIYYCFKGQIDTISSCCEEDYGDFLIAPHSNSICAKKDASSQFRYTLKVGIIRKIGIAENNRR